MKKKFIAVLIVSALIGTVVFAQSANSFVSFKNTIKSPIISVDRNGKVSFAGAYEDLEALYSGQKLDIYAKGRVKILTDSERNGCPYGIGYVPSETYFGINYKPTEHWGIGIGQAIYIPGSYLYAEGDNIKVGNIGSPGATVAYKNTWGDSKLTGAVSFDFMSGVYNNNFYDANGNYRFNIAVGAIYEYKDIFSIGVQAINSGAYALDWKAGAYISVKPCDEFTLNLGYTYNNDDDNADCYIVAEHALSMSFDGYVGNFFYCADINAAVEHSYDPTTELYLGAILGYTVIDDLDIDIYFASFGTYDNYQNALYIIQPEFTWRAGKAGKFVFTVEFDIQDSQFSSVSFPCKWVYKF